MNRSGAVPAVVWCLLLFNLPGRSAHAATEVRLDKDFLAGIVEKLPPSPFEKKGQYKGTVHSYRLLAIDPKRRRFLAACQVEGEFRPPVSGPLSEHVSRSDGHTTRPSKFRFDITTGVNIEAGADAMPRFRVEVEEIKKAELEGIVGLLAKLLGKYFDDMVTQIAEGRASLLNKKLNAEVLKRAAVFKEYGVFCGIDYSPDQVILHFDLTRLKSEGIARLCIPHASARNRAPLPLGRPPVRFPRVHHESGRTRPTQPGQRGRRLPCPGPCGPGSVPALWLARPEGSSLHDGSRWGGLVRDWASRQAVSPFTCTPDRSRARFPSTGSSHPATRFTSTQLTRTRSSPSNRFNAGASSPARWPTGGSVLRLGATQHQSRRLLSRSPT